MAAHPAFALDGPLEGSLDLTVEDEGGCEGWPCEVTWTDPDDGEEYLYGFESVSVSRGETRPVYAFVPTANY